MGRFCLVLGSVLIFTTLFSINLQANQFSTVLNTIISPNGIPSWKTSFEHKYKNNIFHLKIDGKDDLATRFILNDYTNYLVTNTHVAITIRLLNKIHSVFGVNDYGWFKIIKIILVDKELDFALLEFEWIDKAAILATISYSINIPNVNDNMYIIGYCPQEIILIHLGLFQELLHYLPKSL